MQVRRRDFFKERFAPDELRSVLEGAGLTARDVISTRSKVYRERSGEIDALDDDALIVLMTQEPTLLRRPLVVADGTAFTGFDRTALQGIASRVHTEGE